MPVAFIAHAKLPTVHGEFIIHAFEDIITHQEHVLLTYGIDPQVHHAQQPIQEPVLIRIHSECLTGDAFGSLRCECGPQLNATFKQIVETGQGAILYLRQEGRGIGLVNKIRAYALQDQGHDTLDANLLLGLPADAREYDMCYTMLNSVGIRQVRLLTNNPLKVNALQSNHIQVVERVPLHVGENPHNKKYLETKQLRMKHMKH